jgi:hypothetical protein
MKNRRRRRDSELDDDVEAGKLISAGLAMYYICTKPISPSSCDTLSSFVLSATYWVQESDYFNHVGSSHGLCQYPSPFRKFLMETNQTKSTIF